jgi:hypothetical protein
MRRILFVEDLDVVINLWVIVFFDTAGEVWNTRNSRVVDR